MRRITFKSLIMRFYISTLAVTTAIRFQSVPIGAAGASHAFRPVINDLHVLHQHHSVPARVKKSYAGCAQQHHFLDLFF